MSDELLGYYNQELAFIRRMAKGFADRHRLIAGRLALGPDASEDPHVERLIQSFAFLNARTRRKLDDEFPEITESLLGVLYPHYQAPIPSMGVVELALGTEQTELPDGKTIPEGTTIETAKFDQGASCKFRTCYPVTLWPIKVSAVSLARPPMPAPTPRVAGTKSILKMTLRHIVYEAGLHSLNVDSLRFFLSGQDQHVNLLYELMFNHVLDVAVVRSAKEGEVTYLKPEAIRPVGLSRDEGMMHYPARSFVGYRLLTEFFLFPEKFLFFDLFLTPNSRRDGKRFPPDVKGEVEIYFFLNRATENLEQWVSAETFRLGCTPTSNLYRMTTEPITLNETTTEYRVVPDDRWPLAHEVHTVDRVVATSPDNEERVFHPFFSVQHGRSGAKDAFWVASRQPAVQVPGGIVDRGTEVFLSLVDLGQNPSRMAGWTLHVEATCVNRDLPERLPFGGDSLPLSISEALVKKVTALVKFTPTFRLGEKRGLLWRLVSHLSLNHLSLVDDTGESLREVLKLYDFANSPQVQSLIAGVLAVRGEADVARPGGVVCRGTRVSVIFNEGNYSTNNLFLFATVLERFFALYCTINSFSRMVALTGKDHEGRAEVTKELKRWAPRAGERVLI
jgi:type VI secretion system protein ImpG